MEEINANVSFTAITFFIYKHYIVLSHFVFVTKKPIGNLKHQSFNHFLDVTQAVNSGAGLEAGEHGTAAHMLDLGVGGSPVPVVDHLLLLAENCVFGDSNNLIIHF